MRILQMIFMAPGILILDIIPALFGVRNFIEYAEAEDFGDDFVVFIYYLITIIILILTLILIQ